MKKFQMGDVVEISNNSSLITTYYGRLAQVVGLNYNPKAILVSVVPPPVRVYIQFCSSDVIEVAQEDIYPVAQDVWRVGQARDPNTQDPFFRTLEDAEAEGYRLTEYWSNMPYALWHYPLNQDPEIVALFFQGKQWKP